MEGAAISRSAATKPATLGIKGSVSHRRKKDLNDQSELEGDSSKTALKLEDLVKFGALAVLVVQNSALALAMRYSRTVDGHLYPTRYVLEGYLMTTN